MLSPKRTKYRKAHKGRIKGVAKGGTVLNCGAFGLADNSIGGATTLTFRVTYTDTYTYTGSGSSTFPDNIDGTLTLTVDELRASGTLQPLGTGPFVLTRPGYSISGISGS